MGIRTDKVLLGLIKTKLIQDYNSAQGICIVICDLNLEGKISGQEAEYLDEIMKATLPKKRWAKTGYVWKPTNIKSRINFLNKLIQRL